MDVDHQLIQAACELIDRLGDDSYHTVAAAARSATGAIVTGVNVYHFTGGPCAELIVIGRAISDGLGRLNQIVAVGDASRGVIPPCGRCRQVLLDLFPGITVVMPDAEGAVAVEIERLLPRAYRWHRHRSSAPAPE